MKNMQETLIPQLSGSGDDFFAPSSGQTEKRRPVVILVVSGSACYQSFLDLFEGLAKDFEGTADVYWTDVCKHGELRQTFYFVECPFVVVIRSGKVVGTYSCPESLTGVRSILEQWRATDERRFLGLQPISA